MFEVSHETLVAFSKSWGLFYLMGFFLCVVAYAFWPSNRKRFDSFWPSNRKRFDRAKTSILDRDDKPWK
jgi:cytochrome c oxidase cbb3-type subunit IV